MMFENSSVLITGASRGIGRSIAITFAAVTNRPLLLLSRDKIKLLETKRLCINAGAEHVEILKCDATEPEQLDNITFRDGFPEPGIIINNAGGYLYKTLKKTTQEEFQQQINLNLFTTVNVVKRFVDSLLRLDRALIINICSVGALHGLAESGAYSSAKHALLGYTRSLREELKDTEVGVTAINLGQTHSTSWDNSTMSPDKLINPSDVAALIVQLTELTSRTLVEEMTIQPQHGRVSPM